MDEIALSGVIGALSHALDIAEGETPGHAIRSCVIGMRLAAELDLSDEERSDLFYALLLKDAGCSANANRMSVLFAADDRITMNRERLLLDAKATLHQADSIAAIAGKIGVAPERLQDTVDAYNAAFDAGALAKLSPPRSDKVKPWPIRTAPFFALPLSSGITNTMGGIVVDGKIWGGRHGIGGTPQRIVGIT